jgi:high-affinity Fe2+/Pb2+ permease
MKKSWKEIQQAVSIILWSIAVLSSVIGFVVYAVFNSMSFMCHCFAISFVSAIIAAFFTTSKSGGGLPFSY